MILWFVAAALGALVWEAYGDPPPEEGREPEKSRPHLTDASDPFIHVETVTDRVPSSWTYS